MSKSNFKDKGKKPFNPPKTTLGDLFTRELNQDEKESAEKGKGEEMEHTYISDMKDGENLESTYFCSQKNLATTRQGKPYLNLTIADKTGEVVVRVFDDAKRYGESFSQGDFIYIQGRSQIFQNNMQVIARHVEKVSTDDLDPAEFLPASRKDPKKMEKDIRRIIETIKDEDLKKLCEMMMEDKEIWSRFLKAPAAKGMHHNYMFGLLEHTLSMARLAEMVCGHYANTNRDMILTGVIFHDIGKIYELSFDVAIDYTDSGKLIGHINMGAMIIEKLTEKIENFPKEKKRLLQHIVLSHHGIPEFGAAKVPATVEANIIHHLDNLDAKVNAYLATAEKSPTDSAWTDKHFLLGTQVRKTVAADGPLYDFFLPDDEKDSE